jgi:hypothetical protein
MPSKRNVDFLQNMKLAAIYYGHTIISIYFNGRLLFLSKTTVKELS